MRLHVMNTCLKVEELVLMYFIISRDGELLV